MLKTSKNVKRTTRNRFVVKVFRRGKIKAMVRSAAKRKAKQKRQNKTSANRVVRNGAKRNLERLPFVRTDRSVRTVRKWNASVLRTERTGSGRTGPALELGPASSLAPARLHA